MRQIDERSKIAVPLFKCFHWRVHCDCGGYTDVGAGAVGFVDKVYCSKCKAELSNAELISVFNAIRDLFRTKRDVSLVTRLYSCDVIETPPIYDIEPIYEP